MTSKGIQNPQKPRQQGLEKSYSDDRLPVPEKSKEMPATEKRAQTSLDQYVKELSSYKIKLIAGIVIIIVFFLATNIIAGWNPFGALTTVIVASYSIFCLLSNRRE